MCRPDLRSHVSSIHRTLGAIAGKYTGRFVRGTPSTRSGRAGNRDEVATGRGRHNRVGIVEPAPLGWVGHLTQLSRVEGHLAKPDRAVMDDLYLSLLFRDLDG